jgi:hypothetical protein
VRQLSDKVKWTERSVEDRQEITVPFPTTDH